MKYSKILILVFSISAFSACKKLDNLLVSPNGVDPSKANVDLLLNSVQGSVAGAYTALSDFGGQLTRQQQMFGPIYNNAYQPVSFDGIWSNAYTGVLKNASALIPLAIEKKQFIQAGIAQILSAYILGTLVDNFGDVPYSEAVKGADNFNPKADQGAEIYKTVLALLDSGIANMGKTAAAAPADDVFYAGDTDKWATLGKTLKFKFLMQTRLVDNTVTAKIEELLTENDLINDAANDFQFRYSTKLANPNSRHPHYASNYNDADPANNSPNDYLADYFMWAVCAEKNGGIVSNANPDVRRRFYFYRQRTNYADVNPNSCSCAYEAKPGHYSDEMPFCLVGGGYWGRDHGDNSGTPPDNGFRTTWGVYPAGGEFDNSQGTSIDYNRGGKGAGIDPIWLSSYTYFLQAEAAVALGLTTNGDAKSLLEKGVRASIDKVVNFPATVGIDMAALYPARIPTQEAIDNYVSIVLAQYDAATTDAQRIGVIIKEYYLAAWGNGIEPYNNYRRTGYPNDLQPTKTTPNPGFFIRSLTYPSVYVNRNTNAPAQKTPGTAANKVFWDNNSDDFIK